jgi:hypothetical protein
VLRTSTLYDGRGKTLHNTIIVVKGSKNGFDGDPLKDVNAGGRAVFVMKDGEVYENIASGSKTERQQTAEQLRQ